jgi:hypothetical protein
MEFLQGAEFRLWHTFAELYSRLNARATSQTKK